MKNVRVFSALEELSKFAADQFMKIGNAAIKSRGRFTVALAGGSTPKSMFALLASDEYRKKIDWGKVFFFFGDERDVSPMSDLSNFRMANETLLSKVDAPESNIVRWRTEIIDPAGVANEYEKSLKRFFELEADQAPEFDLVFLGMGADGHTASLFPNTAAVAEKERLAVSNYVEKLDTNRLTLTFKTINSATNILFLVSGAEKSEALSEVLKGEPNIDRFPAQGVKPASGKVIWAVDEPAAELLN